MSNHYRDLSDSELTQLWGELRERILAAKAVQKPGEAPAVSQEDWDAAFAMRKEIDRRRGDTNPTTDVDFEGKYTTD